MIKVSLLLVSCVVQLAMPAPSAVSDEVYGKSLFAQNLYTSIAKKKGNLLFSPFSVSAVLSIAYQGAGGTTKETLGKILHLAYPKTAALGFKEAVSRLHAAEGISLANKVYITNKCFLNKGFKDTVSDNFNSEVQYLNFVKSEEAVNDINAWFSDNTKNEIKNLVKPDSLNADTELVLLNAVYFKGVWAEKFDPSKTTSEPFYPKEGSKIKVNMMHTKKYFNYNNDQYLDAKVLQLPFKYENLSMVVILPNKKFGIKEVEQKLARHNLDAILKNMHNVEVDVSLPKFNLSSEMHLRPPLSRMGLGKIFDSKRADFSNMGACEKHLHVSKFIQKAFIEVNEEGAESAEAAAATYHASFPRSLPETVKVDRPFLFSIFRKTSEGIIRLVYGRVNNPNKVFSKIIL